MSESSEFPTPDLSNLPPLSLLDLAVIHGTTEKEVRRVATTLNLPPDGPFDTEDFYRINRILMPVPEPHEILCMEE